LTRRNTRTARNRQLDQHLTKSLTRLSDLLSSFRKLNRFDVAPHTVLR
jgi:hypothetical protein